MTNQQIIDEARRIIDGDDVPLWAVAAALQLGYTGDGAVLHVAEVVLKWHDLYGNDQEPAGTASPSREKPIECWTPCAVAEQEKP